MELENKDQRISFLVDHLNDPILNEWERSFIRSIKQLNYEQLDKHQRGVVYRLLGWIAGHE